MSDAPPPPVPEDCDLQDFTFMPLQVARLRDSDLAAEEDPEACWYALLLWAASWHQLPAASLPDNETVLCKLIGLGRDLKTFRKHRNGALRGFIKCSDGRLYHSVVAEQALDAWKGKLEQRWRTECARVRKANQRNDTDEKLPTFDQYVAREWILSVPFLSQGQEQNVSCDTSHKSHGTEPSVPCETASKGQGQGQGQGQNIDTPKPPAIAAGTGRPDQSKYEFEGRTIKLNKPDFDRWHAAYHAIPDFRAELQALDDWLQGENVQDTKRKNWFSGVSALLGRKHHQHLAERQGQDEADSSFFARNPPQRLPESDWRALMGDEEFERRRHELLIADEPARKVVAR